jgi:hypothetical protein
MGELTEYRLRILQNGFTPLPCKGKRPVIRDWQNVTVTPDMVCTWETLYPNARNTGVRCGAIDVDVTHNGGATLLSEATRDWFDGNGDVLTRFGKAPKFLVPVRGEITERKIFAFRDPSGKRHQIEIRPANSQFICDGPHPDTHQPYTWHAGRSLDTVRFEDLPLTNDEDLQKLANHYRDILIESSDFSVDESPAFNANKRDPDEKFDPFERLRTMHPSSAGAADAQPEVIMSLLRRQYHPDEIQNIVVTKTMEVANAANLGWTRETEEKAVAPRLRWAVTRLCREHEPEKHGDLPAWLCADFHEAWLRVHERGERPQLFRNRSGWCVRGETGPRNGGNNTAEDSGAANDASAKHRTDQSGQAKSTSSKRRRSYQPPNLGDVTLEWWTPLDETQLPPREWIYGKHYQRSVISGTIAPGGSGKTSLCMVEAIAMATCRNLLGEQPEERVRVWYHNAEDTQDEVNRRVVAICKHFKIPQQELIGWFIATSCEKFNLRVAKGIHELKVDDATVDAVADKIHTLGIDVAIIDPLVNIHEVTEDHNTKMAAVAGLFRSIAQAENCSIEFEQHTRKMPAGVNGDYVGADARGASAWRDALRSQRVLNIMAKDEAERNAILEHERSLYFHVDIGKANNARPREPAWRRIVSIELANGDNIGVVEPWNTPGQNSEDIVRADRVAEELYLNLLSRLTLSGMRVTLGPTNNGAPTVFARQPEAKAAKVGKRAFEAAQDRLLAAGRICVEPDPAYGGRTKYVRATNKG